MVVLFVLQRSLLQTVIHNLVDSNDETEREHQRNQLQNDKEIAVSIAPR